MNAVILTGASRGLGLALATDLALAGTTVVGVARKESEGWCALAARCPGSVHFIAADLSSAGALSALMPAAPRKPPLRSLVSFSNTQRTCACRLRPLVLASSLSTV